MRARATIRLYNARMIDARKRLGLTIPALAKTVGVNVNSIFLVQRFVVPKQCPEWILRLANTLGLSVEDLWTEEIAGVKPVTAVSRDFDFRNLPALQARHVDRLALPSGEAVAVLAEQVEAMTKASERLPAHLRKALVAHYGLDGGGERTYAEIARETGVTRESVRRNVKRAIHRMQRLMSRK